MMFLPVGRSHEAADRRLRELQVARHDDYGDDDDDNGVDTFDCGDGDEVIQ